jgi:Fungal protein kinase
MLYGQADQNRVAMRVELEGSYDQPNKKLWSEFFPDAYWRGGGSDILKSLQQFYGDTDRPSARRKRRGRRKVLTQGWKDIPKPPGRYTHAIKIERITDALISILNGIISHQGLSGSRVAIDCRQRYIPTFAGDALSRHHDVFLWGTGSPAFPHTSGAPPPSVLLPNKMTKNESPVDWRWCVVPILIKTERNKGAHNNQSLVQLAQSVRDVFAAQPHRRYVPSLLFTETTVVFYVWDRVGITYSEPLDYHARAERFCAIIASIVSWTDERLGFDTSVQYADAGVHISTNDETYVVDAMAPVVQPYSIINNGVTCWRARRQDESNTDTTHLIVDTWSDWNVHKEVMAKVQELRSAGPSPAELVSFDVVRRPLVNSVRSKRRLVVDSIHSNRLSNDMVENTANLEHSRLVWRWRGNDCVPLEKFSSILELVCVLRDVVQGMSCHVLPTWS